MEVLQENVYLQAKRNLRCLLVNFRRLRMNGQDKTESSLPQPYWQDLLHSVAGMCSVALPDMELSAIYSSLTSAGSKCIILTETNEQLQEASNAGQNQSRKNLVDDNGCSVAHTSDIVASVQTNIEYTQPASAFSNFAVSSSAITNATFPPLDTTQQLPLSSITSHCRSLVNDGGELGGYTDSKFSSDGERVSCGLLDRDNGDADHHEWRGSFEDDVGRNLNGDGGEGGEDGNGENNADNIGKDDSSDDGRAFDNPFLEIFSASESSESESAHEDEYSESRTAFLTAVRSRRSHSPPVPGVEDTVAGCGCFLQLSSRPKNTAVQVLLLAVRRRWRRKGLGSYLMKSMKDPAIVGPYDILLTFADHKAEHFFTTHGFSDDAIITARYRDMVDHWENSTLMAYTPPFSGMGNSDLESLALCENHFKSWRDSAIASYSEQVCLMQRLRHEVMLLHSKLESREALVISLTQQLEQTKRDKDSLEQEYETYRKHSQKLLCEAAASSAQDWLISAENYTST